jgi:hypothetical protein
VLLGGRSEVGGGELSTFGNVTPPLLPQAATANIMVSLLLHLMKYTVLAESSWPLCFHLDLSTLLGHLDMSQVGVTLLSRF